jgi:hypothetical protein
VFEVVDVGGEVELGGFFGVLLEGDEAEEGFEEESAEGVEKGVVGVFFRIVEIAVVGETVGEGAC